MTTLLAPERVLLKGNEAIAEAATKRKINHGHWALLPGLRTSAAATATSGKIQSARANFTGTAIAKASGE